ncbi:PhnA domain-containing protein [Endozoicomonas arenosclerae]|uniref:PhnA domain-containing protein n=1 Tax=Endozoicomonas arenosclerae TaxID=1633495 RepID=UPI000782D7E7|nr:alkylphosphonate utilization protein [Endozoicomonas arenosclerae]
MSIENTLQERSGSKCELCSSNEDLSIYVVPESPDSSAESHLLLCTTCVDQIDQPNNINANHWRCLNDSMWSQVPAVQVMAWRMLNQLSSEPWAQDLLDMMYLEEEVKEWAEAGLSNDDDSAPTLDSNGTRLEAGDTVTLIKDLDVKGAGFTAKRGTTVKNISLTSNPEHIEGRVNGVRIVLVSKFLKKA